MAIVRKFAADTSGAVTVDWVVLTAAVVGLMLASVNLFFNGVGDHADKTAAELSTRAVGEDFR